MKKNICKLLAVAILGVSVTSCQTNQEAGTGIGAVAGALIGSQFGKGSGKIVGIGLGALLGGFFGGQIGSNLDAQDKAKMGNTAHRSLESARTGQTSTWRNPDTGHRGTFTPTKTYQASNGRYCREYQTTVTVGGKTQKAYGTACRQPDGDWEVVS